MLYSMELRVLIIATRLLAIVDVAWAEAQQISELYRAAHLGPPTWPLAFLLLVAAVALAITGPEGLGAET